MGSGRPAPSESGRSALKSLAQQAGLTTNALPRPALPAPGGFCRAAPRAPDFSLWGCEPGGLRRLFYVRTASQAR